MSKFRLMVTAGCGISLVAGLAAVSATGGGSAAPGGSALRAQALKAFETQMAARSAPNKAAHHTRLASAPAANSVVSYNWSGYADTGTVNEFTKVSGSWVVPKLTCTSEDRITSEWVGLDGYNDGTVEQDGFSGQCFEGSAFYYTWYEMYPAGTVEIGGTVKVGDHIAALVNRSGSTYTLTVTDSTTSGNSGTFSATCALTTCTDQSVEWITERPAYATTGIVPLAQFAPAKVTAAKASGGGKSGVITTFGPANQITIIDSTGTYGLDTTSALNATGNSFTNGWLNSY